MLEEILHIRNVRHAVQRVTSNGGASGVDGMQIDKLRDYLNTHWQTLRSDILSGIATKNRRLFYAAIFSFSNSISSICLGVLYPRAECVLLVL